MGKRNKKNSGKIVRVEGIKWNEDCVKAREEMKSPWERRKEGKKDGEENCWEWNRERRSE